MWSSAASVFVVVALATLTAVAAWEHKKRDEEHAQISALVKAEIASVRLKMDAVICTGKLNLFFQTLPKGQTITWHDIPSDYWPCMPGNLIEERKTIK